MTYQDTLDYLFRQLPMFQRIGPAAMKKDLGNIRQLCEVLDQPHTKFRSIHLAGTNGKGSTAHLLSAVLQAAGYKVGLYTSPHYRDFRERIKINGQPVGEAFVIDFVNRHRAEFEQIQPSFFEITVAMAFACFAQEEVDIAIIETGLGGRLDSTNIVTPLLSVITNISYDHQQFLGDTLPEIAGEKAGIIKPCIPVVIGEEQAEVRSVFAEKALAEQAPLYFASRHYRVEWLREDLEHTYYDVYWEDANFAKELPVNLHGAYQSKNIVTLLKALEVLHDILPVSPAALRGGLAELKRLTNFVGRWQILDRTPLTICDSAHNEGGLGMVMRQLERVQQGQLHFVLGMVKDKDLSKVLRLLPPSAIYYFAKADIPRGLAAESLQTQAQAEGLQGDTYSSVAAALAAARQRATANDTIYIGGSIFTVAEVI